MIADIEEVVGYVLDHGMYAVLNIHWDGGWFSELKDESWGKAQSTRGTDAEVAELINNMDMMKAHFVDQGIPVIIGEYGCATKTKEAAEQSYCLFLLFWTRKGK